MTFVYTKAGEASRTGTKRLQRFLAYGGRRRGHVTNLGRRLFDPRRVLAHPVQHEKPQHQQEACRKHSGFRPFGGQREKSDDNPRTRYGSPICLVDTVKVLVLGKKIYLTNVCSSTVHHSIATKNTKMADPFFCGSAFDRHGPQISSC